MDKVVSQEYTLSYDHLHVIILEPRLSVSIVDRAMSTIERIEYSKLIGLYVKVLGWDTLITWDVSTTKEHTCHTICQ